MRPTVCLLLLSVLQSGAQTAVKHRVLFNRFRVPEIGLFVADADGGNERSLPHRESEYSPSLTPDGRWIVFTSERAGQADLYRIHPDGSGLEQLTDDPAFDDQGSLSPDGKSLAFISTRGEGFANLWLLDLATGAKHLLARLPADADVRDFDVSASRPEIGFDQLEASSEMAVIDRALP